MEVVSFEIAKKLKEKGFRELCTHFYRNGTSTPQEMFCGLRSNTHHKWAFNCMEVKLKGTHKRIQVNMVDAPTISQVLKWLREKKRIYLELVIVVDAEYMCDIYKIDVKPIECLGSTDYFLTYELAALAGIEYVIDNLI